jgi:hypothetical protein
MSCKNHALAGFIDLAANTTPLEEAMYDKNEISYFRASTQKCSPFTLVNTPGNIQGGNCGFGRDFQVTVSRVGDYLRNVTSSITLPEVKLAALAADSTTKRFGHWTNFPGHNIFESIEISFNDLCAQKLDSTYLDMNYAFNCPAAKEVGYQNMVGNLTLLTNNTAAGKIIPSTVLTVPIPLFFTKDSGVALAVAALVYNEITLKFSLASFDKLFAIDEMTEVQIDGQTVQKWTTRPPRASDFVDNCLPTLGKVEVNLGYAIVNNDERRSMACAPRDILIQQTQRLTREINCNQKIQYFDIRQTQAAAVMYWGLRNNTEHIKSSNYTALPPTRFPPADDDSQGKVSYHETHHRDPMKFFTYKYDSTDRFSGDSAFFSLTQPWYHSHKIPTVTGFHMYSFALESDGIQPMGSVNQGKISSASGTLELTDDAHKYMGYKPTSSTPTADDHEFWKKGLFSQARYELDFVTKVFNLIRISGGALGFPVM